MNPKDTSENEKLLTLIDTMLRENPGTNFERCFPQLFKIFHKYVDSARQKQKNCFPDRETYQQFSAAKLFFDKFKYVIFQKDDETQNIENEDHNLPPLEAFHYTVDEMEMKKNRIMKSIDKGDILHLKVVNEQADHYKLLILNKFGDKRRIIECSLFAVLFKSNPLVANIKPPLQIDDLIRATVFGNLKTEEGEFKKLIVSLNPKNVTDNELKFLKLGRVHKKDIPYYPEDVSKFQSFGEYFKASDKFESRENILKDICSFGCDPLKTGPLYETRFKKKIPDDSDKLLTKATEKLSISSTKAREAAKLLRKGELLNAFLKVEESLASYPNNDAALTMRGKIYLALAGGKPSRKVKKAFLDFEAAMKMNRFNEEAAEFRDAILKNSSLSFTKRKMPEKAQVIEGHLRKQALNEATEAFLKSIKERKVTPKKASSPVETSASSSHPGPVMDLKEEPMEI